MLLFYVYESCLGNLYTSTEELDYEDLRCNRCGDSDRFLEEFETEHEAEKYISSFK